MTILWFLVTISILVWVHEWGHYWVARRCGVRVLRFSLGFGPVLWRYQSSPDATEWVLACLPFGGYVQMLDGREQVLAPEELAQAYDRRPVWQRMLIVLAGPAANFVLALLLYAGLNLSGWPDLPLRLATVPAGSPAAAAGALPGDEIVSVDGVEVLGWRPLRPLLAWAGHPVASLQVRRHGELLALPLATQALAGAALGAPPEQVLGLLVAHSTTRVTGLLPDSAAAQAGLRVGDHIVALNGQPVRSGGDVSYRLLTNPTRVSWQVAVLRNGQRLALRVRPQQLGGLPRLGVQFATTNRDQLIPQQVRGGLLWSVRLAAMETVLQIRFSYQALWAMLKGDLSWRELAGPITIAQGAAQSAELGWAPYLSFLALISLSIGALNLLPLPVLDGGHFLYHAAELFMGRPISARAQGVASMLGFVLLIALTMLALNNDLQRLISSP